MEKSIKGVFSFSWFFDKDNFCYINNIRTRMISKSTSWRVDEMKSQDPRPWFFFFLYGTFAYNVSARAYPIECSRIYKNRFGTILIYKYYIYILYYIKKNNNKFIALNYKLNAISLDCRYQMSFGVVSFCSIVCHLIYYYYFFFNYIFDWPKNREIFGSYFCFNLIDIQFNI